MHKRDFKASPELALFPDDKTRLAASRKALWAGPRSALLIVGLIAASAVGGAVLVPSWRLVMPAWMNYAWVPGAILGSCIGMAIPVLQRPLFRRSLRKQLIAMGIPVCLRCGYDLRGQTEARCPECGCRFDADLLKNCLQPHGDSDSCDASGNDSDAKTTST